MKNKNKRSVRQMPKIYGDLHKKPFSWVGIFRIVYLLLWCGAGVSLVYAVWFSGWFTIHKITVQGTVLTSAQQVRALIPSSANILAVSTTTIRQQLLQDQRIDSVAVLKGLPNSIKIIVTEKEPALVWISGTTSSLLDKDGFVFAQYTDSEMPSVTTPAGILLARVPHVRDDKQLPTFVGKQVVSSRFISFLISVQSQISHYIPQLIIDHIEVVGTTYDVTFFAKQGTQIELNTLGDAGVQIRNLTRLIHQQKATLTNRVDLRIDRWAYVE